MLDTLNHAPETPLTIGQLADRLGVAVSTVRYRLAARNVRPLARTRNLRLFPPSVIDSLRDDAGVSPHSMQ